jgi:hypothetical protein
VELHQIGYTPEKSTLPHQENNFIDLELFDASCRDVLLPEIVKTRNDLNYQGQGLVIIDECTSNASDFFLDVCVQLGIITPFLPPDSSDQTQSVGLGIFAVQKVESKRIRPPGTLNVQTRQVVQAVSSYMKASIPNSITSAFCRADILVEWSPKHEALLARIDQT